MHICRMQVKKSEKKIDRKPYYVGGLILLLAGGYGLSRKFYIGNNLDITLANLDNINVELTGISGNFTVIISNPTNGTLRVKYPYVRYWLNGSFLGNSTPKNELIKLDPGTATEVVIELKLQSLQVLSVLKPVIDSISSGGTATLKIGVKTGIEVTDLPEKNFEIPIV